ncbi:hypothetical protein [Metabacillus bambusae]|uniref:Uncharacterized protein n=1 Tax=Metabacillus bambusae TaxID=2795218 RepID=A0ABS3N5C1_9BACI|nr:hypothetical protein [Metabacillus bambusae]MBO1513235.1 hypothetical protein [Metabacillus bambusae]
MKKRNPAIVKAEKEFYNKGFENGFEQGVEVSRVAAEIIFSKKINELKNIKGIGPKTFELFAIHFSDYLKEVSDDEYSQIVRNAEGA